MKGTWMYSPEQVDELIRMVESGLLKIGKAAGVECLAVYDLQEWDEALETTSREGGFGKYVVFGMNGAAAKNA